jgi:hypothetical protein
MFANQFHLETVINTRFFNTCRTMCRKSGNLLPRGVSLPLSGNLGICTFIQP